jgi:uncharacterized protein
VNLHFDLRQLGRHARGTAAEDTRVDRTFDPAAIDTREEDYRLVAPVHLVMDVHKDRDAYRVTGRVHTRLELECGRCLERFDIPVDSAFELRYVQAAENTGEDEREVEEDDLTTAYYRDETLDLADLMREQLQLALPMKPLCTERCKGLCPVCGTNLNLMTCACAPKWEDPRLAALKGLIDHNKE